MDTKEASYAQGQGYVQNRVFNQNYRSHPNLSYRSSNVENPQFQIYPPQQQPSTPAANFQAPPAPAPEPQDELKTLMQQLLVQQQKMASEQQKAVSKLNEQVHNMYADLHGKFEAVSAHLKLLDTQVAQVSKASKRQLLDTQVAQTAEAVKRQQGVLPAKSDKNPRNGAGPSGSYNHVNFIGSGENELKLMMQEIIDGQTQSAEELKHKISTLEWKVDCLNCDPQHEVMKTCTTGWTRPIDPSPAIDRSPCLANQSIDRTPAIDRSATKQPSSTSYTGKVSRTTNSTLYSPKVPFPGPAPAPVLRQLPKHGDPGRFLVPCSINGVVFEDALCDSGSTVNVMSTATAKSLGINNIRPSTKPLRFGDGNISTTQGSVKDLQVRIDDCLIPCDFQVVEMSNNAEMTLILGRPFLKSAGALFDFSQERVSLARVNKGVFYVAVKVDKWLEHDSCDVIEEMTKPKSGGAPLQPHVTLTPQRRVGDAIEYKSKCKGMSKPFSKIKALITPELKAQGQAAVDAMMNRVLKLEIKPPPPPPDPPADLPSQA